MKYNPHEGKVFVLKEAKKFLWNGEGVPEGEEEFICIALNAVANECPGTRVDAYRVRHIIRQRLEGYITLEGWLEKKGINVDKATRQQLQQHRHAWVDKLIEEFSS